jgi:hypothetical protein
MPEHTLEHTPEHSPKKGRHVTSTDVTPMPRLRGKASSQAVTPKAKHNLVGSDSDNPFIEIAVQKGKAKKGKAVSKEEDEVVVVEDDNAVGENKEVQDGDNDGDPVMDVTYQDKHLSKTYEKLPHLRFALQCFHIGFLGLMLSCFQSILRRPGPVWRGRVDSSAIC